MGVVSLTKAFTLQMYQFPKMDTCLINKSDNNYTL